MRTLVAVVLFLHLTGGAGQDVRIAARQIVALELPAPGVCPAQARTLVVTGNGNFCVRELISVVEHMAADATKKAAGN
jgi:hypothetical protein